MNVISLFYIVQLNVIKQHNHHLHFIPEASHFTIKVLLAAYLHSFLLNSQTPDLRESKEVLKINVFHIGTGYRAKNMFDL